MAKKQSASSSSSSPLASLSAAELHAEIRRRSKGVTTLVRKRERLQAKIAEVDKQIAAMGPVTALGLGIRKRPKNDSNLVDALGAVLTGKTMSVTDIAEAVQKAGYQTTSPNFRTIVNQALINSKKFKRVSRGQYTAK